MDGPEKDAADFMAELREENPDTYHMWLKITSREEFHEKFRRSFISALCKFCINRKQMELARYRRDFVGCVLGYTKADIAVNLFCDKNGGGYLNNSLKSRRAYRKRLMEASWQQNGQSLMNESAFNTLLKAFHQSSQPSLELQRLQADAALLTAASAPVQPKAANESQAAKAEVQSANFQFRDHLPPVQVFVRYRRVSSDWRDLTIRQTKLQLPSFASAHSLLNALERKWSVHLEEDEVVVRVFDRDFGEFIDLDERLENVSLVALAKYEVIQRERGPDEAGSLRHILADGAVGCASSSRETPSSAGSCSPTMHKECAGKEVREGGDLFGHKDVLLGSELLGKEQLLNKDLFNSDLFNKNLLNTKPWSLKSEPTFEKPLSDADSSTRPDHDEPVNIMDCDDVTNGNVTDVNYMLHSFLKNFQESRQQQVTQSDSGVPSIELPKSAFIQSLFNMRQTAEQ